MIISYVVLSSLDLLPAEYSGRCVPEPQVTLQSMTAQYTCPSFFECFNQFLS
jgi:hypothetical protein